MIFWSDNCLEDYEVDQKHGLRLFEKCKINVKFIGTSWHLLKKLEWKKMNLRVDRQRWDQSKKSYWFVNIGFWVFFQKKKSTEVTFEDLAETVPSPPSIEDFLPGNFLSFDPNISFLWLSSCHSSQNWKLKTICVKVKQYTKSMLPKLSLAYHTKL